MLEVEGVSYRHTRQPWLFRNLSLSIAPGEIVGLYGKSGSGKTTLAQVIANYLKPEEGIVKVNEKKVKSTGPNPVQLVWQHPEKAINPRWKMKNVLAEAGNVDPRIFDALGIAPSWMTRYPSELSGGELQRFCVARALAPNTEYLIADEMTTMLDAITQAQIWYTILQLAKKRAIGVLVISHDEQLLERICDRVIDFNQLH
ncbi:ATP-binding cassette domain-containing protein [Sporosarcina sp. BI001-red]|uniref:ABC transporter ATP-binding protein n=1 Tax=Sporosarcina sp. BI001-red TaxID=2282866 RepID=UPI000E253E20|nr:ATP-binding cassette domain-containing protein [Sporosarcina sp. BI001-red]REB06102.1 ATP-binding cassette domain-containing protein [Sporosarcina sp. BI001-red]